MSDQHMITIANIPENRSPVTLARKGEIFALETMGAGPGHPSPEAWARAGISANLILRVHATISLDQLVALLAFNCDPAGDASTLHRAALIGGYQSVETEWLNELRSVNDPSQPSSQ